MRAQSCYKFKMPQKTIESNSMGVHNNEVLLGPQLISIPQTLPKK